MTLTVLKRKEHKALVESLNVQWGCELTFADQVFVLTPKEKVFLASRAIFELDLASLRVNSIGAYFAEVKNDIRLSIEGAQIIGPHATKNIVDIAAADVARWFKGEDLAFTGEGDGFVILRHGDDYLGCGKVKDGAILNFCPKSRRVLTR